MNSKVTRPMIAAVFLLIAMFAWLAWNLASTVMLDTLVKIG
jgi:hypothetical protein